jgi:hypothetical protein
MTRQKKTPAIRSKGLGPDIARLIGTVAKEQLGYLTDLALLLETPEQGREFDRCAEREFNRLSLHTTFNPQDDRHMREMAFAIVGYRLGLVMAGELSRRAR